MTQPRHRGAGRWAWLRPTLLAAVGVITSIGLWYVLTSQMAPISDEDHVVEMMQAGLWGFSAVAALPTIAQQPAWADRGFAAWMAVLGLLALLRELDLHVVLNLLFPVRFKTQWLFDLTVPWWHRMTWVGLGVGLAFALVSPLWRRRVDLKGLLRGGDAGMGLMAMAFACLGLGYALDDVLGRGLVLSRRHSRIIEETWELLGVLACYASSIVHWRWPLTSRI